VMLDGRIVWDSLSVYLPTPLEVLRNPWIQWMVLLPRDVSGPEYEGIRATAPTVLRALGPQSGLTHLEWFQRPDGTVAVSEVAVRPPGAQITSMLCYAHDFDLYSAWAQLMVHGSFAPAGTQLGGGDGVPARPGNGACPVHARPRQAAGRGEFPRRRVAPAGAPVSCPRAATRVRGTLSCGAAILSSSPTR